MRVAPMSSRFLDACRRRPTDVRPVWFMRQAGRYLKQYRQIREKHGMLEMCKRPDLAATVTLQRGVNVMVLKVINEKGEWAACARFVDREGTVIKNLRATMTPK